MVEVIGTSGLGGFFIYILGDWPDNLGLCCVFWRFVRTRGFGRPKLLVEMVCNVVNLLVLAHFGLISSFKAGLLYTA